MTFRQIMRVTDLAYNGVTRVIQRLESRGEVCHCRWVNEKNDKTKIGMAATTFLIALTKRGMCRLVHAGVTEKDQPAALRSWNGEIVKFIAIHHDLDVVDLMISFRTATRQSEIFRLVGSWMAPARKKIEVNGRLKSVSATYDQMPDSKYVVADAIMRIENNDTKVQTTLYLEYERYADRSKVVRECTKKLINYRKLFLHENRQFSGTQCMLLYVVADKTRISEIFKMDEAAPLLGVFRVAHIDDVIADPLGKVWLRGQVVKGNFSLVKWSPVHG